MRSSTIRVGALMCSMLMWLVRVLILGAGLVGCGEAASRPSMDDDGVRPLPTLPAVTNGGLGGASGAAAPSAYCSISADCSRGAHCHLGECVALCGADQPCSSGLRCSPRGRCLEPNAADVDPPPSSSKAGTIRVLPTDVQLTEQDDLLRLTIATDSRERVAFRVETNGPHLTAATTRGEFEGETVVEVAVDASRDHGLDVPGTIRIVTTLGDVIVNAPLRVGLTGRYEGALRYSVGGVPLGDARIVLDLQETLGDVLAGFAADRR